MRYLTLAEVLELHHRLMQDSGGAGGVRELALLESVVAQPLGAFGGQELYPSLAEKAAALAYSLVSNHPFIDGNKRVAHVLHAFERRSQKTAVRDIKLARDRYRDLLAWRREQGYGR